MTAAPEESTKLLAGSSKKKSYESLLTDRVQRIYMEREERERDGDDNNEDMGPRFYRRDSPFAFKPSEEIRPKARPVTSSSSTRPAFLMPLSTLDRRASVGLFKELYIRRFVQTMTATAANRSNG